MWWTGGNAGGLLDLSMGVKVREPVTWHDPQSGTSRFIYIFGEVVEYLKADCNKDAYCNFCSYAAKQKAKQK